MATSRYKYQTNAGNIFYARTDNNSGLDDIRGTEPTGNTTEDLTFEFSKNSKEVGCRPRSVVLRRDVSDTNGNNDTCLEENAGRLKYVVSLTKTAYDDVKLGDTVTVNGIQYTVVGKRREEMR